MFYSQEYWKNYMHNWFGSELIDKWEANVSIEQINSNEHTINLEVYTSDINAPTIIFAHGIAGYARVLLPFIIPLVEKGYNVIAPDLQGYGYNKGLKGDFEWNAHKENLKDVFNYAKKKFRGKIFLGGASMGGPLAYSASCEVDNVDGLICWCLWDFSDREFMLNETNTKKLTYLIVPILKALSPVMGKLRIKTYKLISYDTLTDSEEFNEMVKNDPQAGTHITLKGAASLVTQSKPSIKHSNYKSPVLVFQPKEDKMTPRYYIEKTFKSLGSKNKKLVLIDNAPHFPIDIHTYHFWADEVDKFIKAII